MSYKEAELAHAYKISKASHILVHASLLAVAIRTLESIGFTKPDARKRVIIASWDCDIPGDILAEGWVGIERLVPAESPSLPERFDGDAADETAVIYFSSGEYSPGIPQYILRTEFGRNNWHE